MNKQEIYDALVAKFNRVQPINQWEKRNAEVLGISAYLIQAWADGDVPKAYTLHVADDNTATEKAFFVNPNLLAEQVVQAPSFSERVVAEIERRKGLGQIVEAFVDGNAMGQKVCEVVAYKESGTGLTSERYVIWDIDGTDLGFKKLV